MIEYTSRDGQPLNLNDWAALYEDPEYRQVARTDLPDTALVSTIWLGFDHNFGTGRTPALYETMAFLSAGGEFRWRWATEAEATAGHDQIAAAFRDGILPDEDELDTQEAP